MKTGNKQNPYEKDFKEMSRMIKEIDEFELLDSIPDDDEDALPSIPFPYGDKSFRPYNFN